MKVWCSHASAGGGHLNNTENHLHFGKKLSEEGRSPYVCGKYVPSPPPPSPLHRLFLGQGRTYFKIEFKIGSQFAIWLGAELQLVSWSRIGVCNDSAVLFESSLYVSK